MSSLWQSARTPQKYIYTHIQASGGCPSPKDPRRKSRQRELKTGTWTRPLIRRIPGPGLKNRGSYMPSCLQIFYGGLRFIVRLNFRQFFLFFFFCISLFIDNGYQLPHGIWYGRASVSGGCKIRYIAPCAVYPSLRESQKKKTIL